MSNDSVLVQVNRRVKKYPFNCWISRAAMLFQVPESKVTLDQMLYARCDVIANESLIQANRERRGYDRRKTI